MTDARAEGTVHGLAPVLAFRHPTKAGEKFFWTVTFECTPREVLSVQISNAGDCAEDKRRIADCLRNLADDIEWELANGPQAI
jgi:hypothetical protein